MRVLHVGARDVSGGAGQAMYRLHTGLRDIGVDSHVLANQTSSDDDTVHGPSGLLGRAYNVLRREVDRLPVRRYRYRESGLFSPAWLPDCLPTRIARVNPDIVHLHWVGGGVVRPETLGTLDYPIVWTMHDMWPFTGGCHYSAGCERYREACGACPKLHSDDENDVSRRTWQRKAQTWKNREIAVVAPSSWLEKCAHESSLFNSKRVSNIPNGIDIETYCPQPEGDGHTREQFGLPENCVVLLFGAVAATEDARKGFDLLTAALKRVDKHIRGVEVRLAIFGTSERTVTRRCGFTVHELGYVHEESLPDLYSIADAMLVPSREDNLPNTVMEALACGTPCVAFDIGGLSDLIDDRENGYLAQPFDVDDFAVGIEWVTETKRRNDRLGAAARRKTEEKYEISGIAGKYASLYESVTAEYRNAEGDSGTVL